MRVTFKYKGITYQATGIYDKEDNSFCVDTIEYNGEDIYPVLDSLNVEDEFKQSIVEFI